MSGGPSHYEILGVSRHASPAQLTAARNRLAREWHPDRNPGDERRAILRLQAVNAAYEALSDPERRDRYDQELSADAPGFELVCGDLVVSSVGARLRCVRGDRTTVIERGTIENVLIRPHGFGRRAATLVIVTGSGRHRFRLPRDAANALAHAISSA